MEDICTSLINSHDYNLFNYNAWCNALITEMSVQLAHAPRSVFIYSSLIARTTQCIYSSLIELQQASYFYEFWLLAAGKDRRETIQQCDWTAAGLWHRLINKLELFVLIKFFITHATVTLFLTTLYRHRHVREVEVYLHSFWTSGLDEGEWLTSCSVCFNPEKNHQ